MARQRKREYSKRKREFYERISDLESRLAPDDELARECLNLAKEILHEGRPAIITKQQEYEGVRDVETTRALKSILLADAKAKAVAAAKRKRIKVKFKGLAKTAEDQAVAVMYKRSRRLSEEGLRDGLKHPGKMIAILKRIGAQHPFSAKKLNILTGAAERIAAKIAAKILREEVGGYKTVLIVPPVVKIRHR
jgi:hypothetical protein